MNIFTCIHCNTSKSVFGTAFPICLILALSAFFAKTGTAQPIIHVIGNTSTIFNGDNTPSILDFTDFGITSVAVGAVSRTFIIENLGTGTLQLKGTPYVEIVGQDPNDFTVTQQPQSGTISNGQSLTFTVTFNPTAIGVRSALVRIQNNDPNNGTYQFTVMGKGDFDIRDCADPCTGDDVTLSDVELHDANGEVYPPSFCITPGITIFSTFYITVNNNTNANRYAFRISCDVFVDGKDSGDDILSCYDGPLPGNSSVTFQVGTIIYQVGSIVEVRNIKIAWRTAASSDCSNSNTCNNYPGGQCSYIAPVNDFIVSTPLVSNFDMVATPICEATLTASFFSTSTGGTPPYTYSWNFGDPASGVNNASTLSNPSHEYGSGGTYTVTLTVTDSNGVQCSLSNPVQVVQPTIATASGGGMITCITPNLTLTASGSSSGGNLSYQWTSPNGNILSGNTSPNPIVNQAGTYTLLVTDAGTGCTSSATVNILSDLSPPLASAGQPQTLNCLQTSVQLQGSGSTGAGFSTQWTANPGSIVSGANTYTPVVNAAGAYSLLVTNLNNGCTSTATVNVNVDQDVPQANAGSGTMLNCLQTTYQLQGLGSTGPGISIQWTANPGSIVSGGNTYNPVVNKPGIYRLKVTNLNNGCSNEAVVVVQGNFDQPQAVAAAPGVLNCITNSVTLDASASSQGPNIQYSWTAQGAGNIVSGNSSANPVVDKPGTYVLLITNSLSGCTATASVTVTENKTAPTANAGANKTLTCYTTQLALNGSASTGPNYSYTWTTNNGHIVSGGNSLHPIVDTSGTYTLLVTNTTNGCTAQSSVNVSINRTLPAAVVSGNPILNCASLTVALNATGSSSGTGFEYQWTANPGHIVSGSNTLNNAVVDAAGTYTLVVLNTANGCTAQAAVVVDANTTTPIAAILPAQLLTCATTNIQLNANGSSQGGSIVYTWTTPDGSIIGGNNTLVPQINQPGTYNLLVTDMSNSCTAAASVTVGRDISPPTAIAAATAPLTCVTLQVQLNGAGSSAGSAFAYQWTSVNGNIVSGSLTLSPIVNQAGTYSLLVTNLDNGCTAQASTTVSSNLSQPVANAGAAATITCSAPQITLNGNGSSLGAQYSYNWSTVDGKIVAGAKTLNPSVNAAGTYKLTVINIQSGCSATATVTVGVNTTPPLASVAPAGTLNCTQTSVMLDGTGSSAGPEFIYAWSSNSGTILSGQGTLNPQVSAAGTYTLLVTNTTNGCSAKATAGVSADTSIPQANAGPPDTLNCQKGQTTLDGTATAQGNQFTYAWTGPGIVSGVNSLTPLVNQSGVYELLVTNTMNGCTAVSNVPVLADFTAPVANAGPSSTLNCTLTTLALNGSISSTGSSFSYQWSVSGGGNIVSGANTLNPSINSPGLYTLMVTNQVNGCTGISSVNIAQDTLSPDVAAGAAGTITCANATVTLNGSGSSGAAFNYHWTTSNGSIQSGANTLAPVVSAAGTYTLTILNTNNGCTATASTMVNKDVNVPLAQAQAPNMLTCAVQQIQLSGAGSSTGASITYNWTTPNGQILSGANTLSPVVNAPGQYTLNVVNTANNCEALFTVTVGQDLTPPVADAGAPDVLSCIVKVLNLDGSGSSQGPQYAYNWTTANGNIVGGAGTLYPEVDHSGMYTLLVTNTQNGCTAVAGVPVLLDQDAPQALAGPDASLTCISKSIALSGAGTSTGANFLYQWTASAGGNITGGSATLTPVVDAPGVYTLLVTNMDNGCTATDVAQVSIDQTPPVLVIATPKTLDCEVLKTTLNTAGSSAGSGITYQWTTANGNFISGANGPAPVVNQPGTYQVLVTNTGNGCTSAASVEVVQNIVKPVVDAGANGQLDCAVTTLQLKGIAANQGANPQYLWTTADGHIVSGANSLAPLIDAPGTYWFTVINTDNHCLNADYVPVTLNNTPPNAAASGGPDLTCNALTTALDGAGSSVGGQFTYQWAALSGGNILSGANTLSPVVNAPGNYALTVTNTANHCTSTAVAMVEQNITAPIAVVQSPGMLTCVTFSLNLNGAGSSAGNQFRYDWQTNDGHLVSGQNTLNPLVDLPGTYSLQVTDTTNGCTQTAAAKVIRDVNPPVVVAAAPDPLTCSAASVLLSGAGSSAGSNFKYFWTTATGQIAAGATTLSPTVSAPGDYLLLVTNTANGCTGTSSTTVVQNMIPPLANIGAGGMIDCGSQQITLHGFGVGSSQGVSFSWSTQNGSIVSGQNSPDPVVNSGGVYSLLVTDLFNGCTSTAAISIPEDKAVPPAAIAAPGTLTCLVNTLLLDGTKSAQGSQYAYSWSGPGIIAGVNTLQPTVNLPGTYTIQVFNQINGCIGNAATAVLQDIQTPMVDAGPGFEINCLVSDGYLDATITGPANNLNYLWTTQDGNILSGNTLPGPLVNAAGTYLLVVTNNNNGCSASDLVTVTENPSQPSALQLATTSPGCNGEVGMIRIDLVEGGTGPYLYSIDNGGSFHTSNLFDNLDAGNYQVVIQDINGCQYTQPVSLTQPSGVSVYLDPEISLAFGDQTKLVAGINIPLSRIDTIIWTPEELLTHTNQPNVVTVQTFFSQEFTVTVIDTAGCSAKASVYVKIDDPHLWAPNAISPNRQDGFNDVFLIFAAANTIRNIRTLRIYDRWGEMVFRNDNIQPNMESLGWNGYFRGKPMNPAVFVWWADVELVSGQRIIMKGDVTIVD